MADGCSGLDSYEEEMDDDSSSDCEITIKATKRKQKPMPGLQPPKIARLEAAPGVMSSPTPSPLDSSLREEDEEEEQQQRSPGTRRQATPRPAAIENKRNQGISSKDIYDAVCSGKSAMVAVVDEWLDVYKQSREAGLLVLINFIVVSCGCKGVVTRDMFDTMNNAEIISLLTRDFDEDKAPYPLCTPGPQLKRVKAGLCEFTRVLVNSCRNSLIYDEYLFPSLLALLTGMSDSQVRAFRHTSTLFAMKLMTGMVDATVSVLVQQQTTKRQLDMENSKSLQDRAPDRLEGLQAAVGELRENRAELSSMMNGTFRGVFVHRYRDLLPEIRAICIVELGVWLKTDPEDFLNDSCLKYLGWMLHDKQRPVRLQCVCALQSLYEEQEFIGRLELFTGRFKERMLSMVLDKEPDVAVETVNLLLLIQQRTEEGLSEDECGIMYPLVYASHRGLAAAAGGFLYNKLKCMIANCNQEDGLRDNAAFFHILISFYIQSEVHDHGAYLVDSLWGVAGSELRDWETMTALLLQDDGLNYEEEGVLVELMMCTIIQAAQGLPPAGRTRGKKILNMKEKKLQEQDRRRITTHFIPLLPQLLAKYSADAGKVSRLLKAPSYFDLEMYASTARLEKSLDLLLSQVCGIVSKHAEAAVLEACADLVGTLCSGCYTFSSRAHLAFSQLLDGLTECFSTYLSDLLQGTADDNDVYNAAIALKRIAALGSVRDPTGLKLFDSCVELLKSRLESRELDEELMVSALRFAAFHLMWAKVNAVNSPPAEAELNRLKRQVRLFCRVCQNCLSLDQADIRDQAFELLCDLLLLYSRISGSPQSVLQTLVLPPSDSLRSEMAGFLVDYIFSDTDADLNAGGEEDMKTILLLQRKRNQLAGYCKLVIFGVLDLSAATDVFKHYSKYFKDFGDIIKETLSKSKLISPVQSAKTVCLTLQQMFSEIPAEDRSRQNLYEINDLAKRLAMNFGVDLHHVRRPLVALHMDGIGFAFRDPQEGEGRSPNVAFLEILSDFSFKLLPPDRVQLTEFLNSKCPTAALSWPSVRMYQRSLEDRLAKPRKLDKGSRAVSSHETPVAKVRKLAPQGSWLDSSSLQSGLPTPALTSTIQRQPALQLITGKPAAASSASSDLAEPEPESEDEFSGLPIRKVKPTSHRQPLFIKSNPSLSYRDVNSKFTLLSLIEDDEEDGREDPESEDSGSDSYTLPSTRHLSSNVLDELFD
ncbi:cohesin subunit SA-1-like [Brachionichthys hirsutus]|uniref:cohesin subunit SA-1-like n=1 Tax=Brachionichthys hirsutus TaxID=412623 RepID=UPI003605140A